MKKLIFLLLFLPSLCWSNENKKLLILGDSLTEGLGVSQAQAYPSLIEEKFKASGQKFKVINAGVSGDTTAGGLSRLPWYLKTKPDVLLIALGANDGLRGLKPEASQKNLSEIITKAKEAKVKVLLAGMKMPINMGKEYREKFEKIYSQLAKTHQVPLLPFLLEGVGGQKKYNQADGIHPNPEGHKIIADQVYKFLKENI